ncbi:acyl carrier protein [Prosthecobacter sp. SYSU 5D2]|uniref:acyl carrier protein n=1 Tax=Prosthecobacter sp. SYSU 5D2 TaxID=3134134 RepID=UPI0031FED5B5
MSSPATTLDTLQMEAALLHLVNEMLPTLRLSPVDATPVSAETPLFENGRIDSMAILHVIGLIEEMTGAPVPDEKVSMKHFHSIAAITQAFCPASL